MPSRTAVLINGVSENPTHTSLPSASVPKIVNDGGNLYLFWTQVQHTRAGVFLAIKTWGARIEKEAQSGLYWVIGTSAAEPADTSRASEVYRAHPMTDISEIVPIEGGWLVLGHVGPEGCLLPLDPVAGCYRLEIGLGLAGAAAGQFDGMARATNLPNGLADVPVQYPRLLKDPRNGGYAVIINKVGEPYMRLFPINVKLPKESVVSPGGQTPVQTPAQTAPRRKLVVGVYGDSTAWGSVCGSRDSSGNCRYTQSQTNAPATLQRLLQEAYPNDTIIVRNHGVTARRRCNGYMAVGRSQRQGLFRYDDQSSIC